METDVLTAPSRWNSVATCTAANALMEGLYTEKSTMATRVVRCSHSDVSTAERQQRHTIARSKHCLPNS